MRPRADATATVTVGRVKLDRVLLNRATAGRDAMRFYNPTSCSSSRR